MTTSMPHTVLALPGSIGRQSLKLPDDLSHEDWLDLGRQLAEAGQSLQWWVGDWLNFGRVRYGEKYKEALAKLGYRYQTLRNITSVATRFDVSRRRDNLSWGHHEAVASLEPEKADELLAMAEQEEWSVRELRTAARRRKNLVGHLPGGETCTVEDLHDLVAEGRRYWTIYADPPWLYDNNASRGAAHDHYEGMTLNALCELPVAELADDSCHLHLWTTTSFLPDALELLACWGFDYKGMFTWVKPQMGLGNYWRVSHELLLLGVRGGLPFGDNSKRSWIELARTTHSAKPEKIRGMIEAVSPSPRLELFARRSVTGWTVWGNEIPRDLFSAGSSGVVEP